jgi:hypothetical protein
VERTAVLATRPGPTGREGFGITVHAQLESPSVRGELSLTASLVEQNRVAGVLVISSDMTVDAATVRATMPGAVSGDFGDGIVVLDNLGPSHADINATALLDNARAGVLFVGSGGTVSRVRSSGNHFGLVVQPGQTRLEPDVDESNVFERNIEQDKLLDGDLAVPDAELPLP